MKSYKFKYKETHYRSIIKAVSWRIFATITTILIVFIFTRKLALSLGVGVVEVVAKIVFYYVHERVWANISSGRKRHPLSGLPVKDPLTSSDIEKIKIKLKELGYIAED